MKQFYVTLGGKERRLRYTTSDSVKLDRRFGKAVGVLVWRDILTVRGDADGAKRVTGRGASMDVCVAFLHLGLAHDEPKLTEETVYEWIDEYIEASPNNKFGTLVEAVVRAAYMSGIVNGQQTDFDELLKGDKGSEGKDEASQEQAAS